jgi:hypothetical protein
MYGMRLTPLKGQGVSEEQLCADGTALNVDRPRPSARKLVNIMRYTMQFVTNLKLRR